MRRLAPEPMRESDAPSPARRGRRYLSMASSTCSLPSAVFARRAKMFKISAVRSSTSTPRIFSRLRCCAALISSSTIAMSISMAWQVSCNSSALPVPI